LFVLSAGWLTSSNLGEGIFDRWLAPGGSRRHCRQGSKQYCCEGNHDAAADVSLRRLLYVEGKAVDVSKAACAEVDNDEPIQKRKGQDGRCNGRRAEWCVRLG
jgi:hypothetical protein